jgi:hypothetical protein
MFAQWWAFEAASCPRNQTLNEDNTYSLHVTPPLRKHFVGGCVAFTVLHSKPCHLSALFICLNFVGLHDCAVGNLGSTSSNTQFSISNFYTKSSSTLAVALDVGRICAAAARVLRVRW